MASINKKRIILGLLVVALGVGLTWFYVTSIDINKAFVHDKDDKITVTLTSEGYVPENLTVSIGTTVTFQTELGKPHWPASNLHPNHDIYPEFDPLKPISSDETWSFTFDKVGEWDFHDHLRSYYRGHIKVVK